MALDFQIIYSGNPQQKFTKCYAQVNAESNKFLVGYTTTYHDNDGDHVGINTAKFLSQMHQLFYDRYEAAKSFGLWAHFIWPTVVAESSGGFHLMVNTYDRARFTFGFGQLAAHTPNDNLVLLFRELLKLPTAHTYFPDLNLVNGIVHQQIGNELKSLETETTVNRPNGKKENQIVDFMNYLNPDTKKIGDIEVKNAAKLQYWLLNDNDALKISVKVVISIMKQIVKMTSKQYDLIGKEVELAMWVLDITYQARGSVSKIKDALAQSDLQKKLDKLYEIGSENKDYDSRRILVKKNIDQLKLDSVFRGILIGDKKLDFNKNVELG